MTHSPGGGTQPRKSVVHIHSTYGAFAAILDGGTVVTWGYPSDGGDSSDVVEQLHSVARKGPDGVLGSRCGASFQFPVISLKINIRDMQAILLEHLNLG